MTMTKKQLDRALAHYILKGKRIFKVPLLVWAEWFEKSIKNDTRQIGLTKMKKIWVSTVFLGLDHNFGGGKPILFETMVFSNRKKITKPTKGFKLNGVRLPSIPPFSYMPSLDEYTNRYCTYSEAEKGHKEVVRKLQRLGHVIIKKK